MPIERFVLIDDSQDDNWINQRALTQAGFKGTVLTFDWAPDALQFLLNDQISVPTFVLLDFYMPVFTGPDLLSKLEKALMPRAQLQILLATGSEEPKHQAPQHLSPLVSGFYRKPIQVHEIRQILSADA